MKPGEIITNEYGSFEAIENLGCDGCAATMFSDLCHALPPCHNDERNNNIPLIFKRVEVKNEP